MGHYLRVSGQEVGLAQSKAPRLGRSMRVDANVAGFHPAPASLFCGITCTRQRLVSAKATRQGASRILSESATIHAEPQGVTSTEGLFTTQ